MAFLEAVLEFIQDFFINTRAWFHELLVSQGLSDAWVRVISLGAGALVLALVPVVSTFFFIGYEHKIIGRLQAGTGDRSEVKNANPIADVIKLFTQEAIVPAGASRVVFNAAPILIFTTAILFWAVVPFGKDVIGADLNIGIFYVICLGAAEMVAILMAGWGSNNEYAVRDAVESIAIRTSYQTIQALSLLTVVMLAGSFSMPEIVAAQDVWYALVVPISAIVFLATGLPELGHRPLDPDDADLETDTSFIAYSGTKLGMFYLAEFIKQLLISVLFAILFLGGWRGPGVEQIPILGTVWLAVKVFFVNLVIQISQYALPRLRIDQILKLSWKFLIPLSLVNIYLVALIGKAVPYDPQAPWIWAGAFLSANLVLGAIVLTLFAILKRRAQQRKRALFN